LKRIRILFRLQKSSRMNKLEYFIRNLPPYIGREIFSFVVPVSGDICFKEHRLCEAHNYKYHTAFIGYNLIKNTNGFYLSRICKKNNKHRYYITRIETIMVNEEEFRTNHRSRPEYQDSHVTKYVGKDLDSALIKLYYD
jgi:hypothetical protein